jgi:gliding motility-associated-like protein
MKKIKLYLVFLVSLLSVGTSFGQIDTIFWFASPWLTPDHTGIRPIQMHFSTFGNTTSIRIQQPSSTYDTTVVVPANSLYTKDFGFMLDSVLSKPANQILRTGIKITSDFPITCVWDFVTQPTTYYNPETYSLKGQNGMGKEFVLPFQTRWHNRPSVSDNNGDGLITQPYQQFQIVATEDSTTIYITPKTDIVGHAAGVTFSVFLPKKGNVYTGQNIYQDINNLPHNLAGSIVVADKPISITVCEDSVQPPDGCADELGDQIVPTDVIGNEYIVNKGFLNANSKESFFVVATENFTTVTINDGVVTNTIMNQGDTYPYKIDSALTHIQSDKPVYLYHMSGYGCELGAAILPPLNCSGSDQISFPRSNNQSFLLNILCKSGTEGAFQLNGNATLVPAGVFSVVPGTAGAWMGAQIAYTTAQIPAGSSNLITNSMDNFALGIINGGPTTGCLYHYLSSFLRRVYTKAGNDTTLCNGVSVIALNGTVTGGSTTGIWTVLDGSGTLNNPSNLSTTYNPNQNDYNQGYLTFVLSSTGNCRPVTDTLRISFVQSPHVDAGSDDSYCKNNVSSIPLNGTLNYAIGSLWTGGNGGVFGNPGQISTTYTPSTADLSADSVILFLTSSGSLYSCPNDKDTVIFHFTPSPLVNAGVDQYICSSTAGINLNGLVSGGSSTGIWSTSGSGAFSPSQNDLNANYGITSADTAAGVITILLTSSNNGNCLAVSDSLEVSIMDKPLLDITSQDSICANLSSLNLSGTVTPGFNTIWSVDGLGLIANPNALNTIYTINPSDTTHPFIMVYLSTDALICPPEHDSLKLYFIAPPVVNAGMDQAFCLNEPIPLNGIISGPNSGGTWVSTGTGSFSPSNNMLNTYYFPSPLDIANGTVYLVLSSLGDFGCAPDKDTLIVTFKPAPNPDFSSSLACEGANTNFQDLSTASSGTVNAWLWFFGDGDSSISKNPIHTYPGNGNYNVTLIVGGSNGCSDTIQKSITVDPSPIANFVFPVPCVNVPLNISDKSIISAGNVVAWDYNFGNGDFSTQQNPNYTFTSATTYPVKLTVTSDLGCTDDTTISITINPSPNAAFSFDPNPALALENVNFKDSSTGNGINNWHWNFGDGEGDNAQNTTHGYADGGQFIINLVVTDTNGCVDSSSQTLTIGLLPALPTGFSPNGDGENDVFIIRGGPFNSGTLIIYNNWGQQIFQSDDVKVGWDGTYKGSPVPIGVYSWVFHVELYGGKIIKQSGDVTLMR